MMCSECRAAQVRGGHTRPDQLGSDKKDQNTREGLRNNLGQARRQ